MLIDYPLILTNSLLGLCPVRLFARSVADASFQALRLHRRHSFHLQSHLPRNIVTHNPGDQIQTMAKSVSTANVASALKRKNEDFTPPKSTRQRINPPRGKYAAQFPEYGSVEAAESSMKPKAPKSKKSTGPSAEKRLRRFRQSAPVSYRERLQRAVTQRMFVVNQTVTDTDGILELEFDIVGSTGNIYKTTIGKVPTCNCPDSLKGNQCKHICYVLVKVLKAPAHLQYQLAFLSNEIREIYEKSPLRDVKDKAEDHDTEGKRKPIEGDCPICFMEFEPGEDIVWCRAACGNNIHKACFQQWAATKHHQGVRCVYCRSPWQNQDADGKPDVDLKELLRQGRIGADGYVNVANQMGLSGERDYSTYHRYWVRRQSYSSGWLNHYYDNDYYE
ncbi:hypothetical protein BDV18DRAFT_94740 [Aspergillus unguis]